MNTLQVFTGPNTHQLEKEISTAILAKLEDFTTRLQQHEPIQHILGYAYFDDLKLNVSPDVLIPRQETEELIYWIKEHHPNTNGTFIDFGTGSGAIALALAKHYPKATITAVDISSKALAIAKKNAEIHHLKLNFQQGDILALNTIFSHQTFDVIVSNPPYISPSFIVKMPKNVTDFEPHLALFAPKNDVLIFYRKIIEFATTHLNKDGLLFFEINEFYKDELLTLIEKMGLKGEAKQDLNGNWRMVKCSF